MNSLLPLALAALLASPACAQTQLTGDIAGLGTRTIEYTYTQQGQVRTDSVRVIKDHFALRIKGGDDGMGKLLLRDKLTRSYSEVPIWVEPGTVRIQGAAAQPYQLDATGTPENKALSEYNHTVAWKSSPLPGQSKDYYSALRAKRQQETRQFIQAHPATRTSAYLLDEQLQTQPNYPVADYEKLAQALAPAVRQSWYGPEVAKHLDLLRRQPTVGQPVADFSIADTAGVQHSLATYRGKYVLLDFWGHWRHPCIEAMPKVNALHQQYADKLTIIGIALEGTNSAPLWKKAIRQYQVPGLQLSELKGTDSPVITGYTINAFPTYLLLDPQGKLVARTSDVDEITKKLATLGSL